MIIKYKIIELHPEQHSIVVRFYSDDITEEMLATQTSQGKILRCRTDYNIDLPIPAPEGFELEKFIFSRAPTDWLELQVKVLDPNVDTSLSTLVPLIDKEVTHSTQHAIEPLLGGNI